MLTILNSRNCFSTAAGNGAHCGSASASVMPRWHPPMIISCAGIPPACGRDFADHTIGCQIKIAVSWACGAGRSIKVENCCWGTSARSLGRVMWRALSEAPQRRSGGVDMCCRTQSGIAVSALEDERRPVLEAASYSVIKRRHTKASLLDVASRLAACLSVLPQAQG